VVALIFFLPPQYNSGKYVHHLPCGVQETVETTSHAFAVQGGVMQCTSTTMEIYQAPQAPSSARLLLPCIHRGAQTLYSLQCPWGNPYGTARYILLRMRK
jgi:hypothetical protein